MASRLSAAVADARYRVFGEVVGTGRRSGRKILRKALKGAQVASYYPFTLKELKAPFYEEPAIEDLYRVETELNRVGKTRVEGKLRPIRAEVASRIALADYNMETVNWETVRMDDPASVSGPGGGRNDRSPQLIALVKEEVEE